MTTESYFSIGPARGSERRRILVVDDDECTRCLYSVVFSRCGYQVEDASDGEEAWQALVSGHYDLLLTDQNMPQLTGLELVARLREAGMRLPVVLNSGCDDLGSAADYPELGLQAIIEKSADLSELLETVRRAFGHLFSWSRGDENENRRTHGWLRVPTAPSG